MDMGSNRRVRDNGAWALS